MPHLLRLAKKEPDGGRSEAGNHTFPFSLPVIRALPALNLDSPVTFFVGENGSGKSTLLEAIAYAAELPALGADQVAFDDTLVAQRALGAALRLSWSRRSRRGLFLRAEDFFGYLRRQARDDARIQREYTESADSVGTDLTDAGPGARHVDERNAARTLAATTLA